MSRSGCRKSQLVTAFGALVVVGAVAHAQTDADRPVATVGESKITVAQVQKSIGRVPLFQLKNLGDSSAAVKRTFVEQLTKRELLVQGALDAKLDERVDVRDRIRTVLTSALLNELRGEAIKAGDVSDQEVAKYYADNKARYTSALRIKIWQIVVGTQAEAQALLDFIAKDAEYAKDPIAGWDKLAREKSLDKSTAMRKGNLGFVQADGQTAHKDLRVPKELFEAAAKLQDGELLSEPLGVAGRWVVLQRRGSHQTPERTLQSEAATIRSLLAKQKVQARTKELLEGLRQQYVKDKRAAAVDQIDIDYDGEISPKNRPGTLKRRGHPAAGKNRPAGQPGHLR